MPEMSGKMPKQALAKDFNILDAIFGALNPPSSSDVYGLLPGKARPAKTSAIWQTLAIDASAFREASENVDGSL